MKHIIRGIAAAALCVLSAACSSASAPAPDPLRIAGDYILVELYDDDGSTLNDELAELNAGGESVTLHLAEDGTGTYVIFNEPEDITWTESTITFRGETLDTAWTRDRFTIYPGGGSDGKMVFAPTDSTNQ